MDSGTLIHIHYNEKLKMVNFFEKIFYAQVVQDACLTGVALRCSKGFKMNPLTSNFFYFFIYNNFIYFWVENGSSYLYDIKVIHHQHLSLGHIV